MSNHAAGAAAAPCDILLAGEQTAHVVRLAAALVQRGWQVAALDAPRLCAALRDEAGIDLPCHAPAVPRLRGRYRSRAVRALERCARRVTLRDLLQHVRPQVVHINGVDPRLRVFAELGSDSPAVVATVWGTDVHTLACDGTPAQRRDIAAILNHARIITADAPHMLEMVTTIVGPQRAADLRLVLFGIDVEAFAAPDPAAAARWRTRLGIEPGHAVVLAPRRINARYAPHRVLEAFAAAPQARRGVLVFKLFGDNPAEESRQRSALEERAAALGLAGRLRFAPPCPYAELPGLYALAAVACFLLDRDGTPSTALELWASGTPLVAADIPHYRGILSHEHNALLSHPDDIATAARLLDRGLAGRGDITAMVRRGQACARAMGSEEGMVAGMCGAYAAAGLAPDPGAGPGSRGAKKAYIDSENAQW